MQAKRWSMKARTWIINSTLQWKQVSGYLINILFEIMLVSWCSKIDLLCHQFDAEPMEPLFFIWRLLPTVTTFPCICDGLNLWLSWRLKCCLTLSVQRILGKLILSMFTAAEGNMCGIGCKCDLHFFTKTSVRFMGPACLLRNVLIEL